MFLTLVVVKGDRGTRDLSPEQHALPVERQIAVEWVPQGKPASDVSLERPRESCCRHTLFSAQERRARQQPSRAPSPVSDRPHI